MIADCRLRISDGKKSIRNGRAARALSGSGMKAEWNDLEIRNPQSAIEGG
jgi:hypothetical protein